jgi:hypothetical protein
MRTNSIFSEKRTIKGKFVAIMNFSNPKRGINLTEFKTRCLLKSEIHEFILCAEDTDPSKPIDKVFYLGFGELLEGGVMEIGDTLYLGDKPFGTILGFDETHFPNHYNILITTKHLQTGLELGVKAEDGFSVRH